MFARWAWTTSWAGVEGFGWACLFDCEDCPLLFLTCLHKASVPLGLLPMIENCCGILHHGPKTGVPADPHSVRIRPTNPSLGPFHEDMKLIYLWVPSFVHDAEGYPWSSHCEQNLSALLSFLPAFEI